MKEEMEIQRAAALIADEISERGLEFRGKFEDVRTVLEVAIEEGLIVLVKEKNGPR